ncbi:MAG: hypothetical protein WC929_04810 [Bacilli bacterium]
MIKIIKKVLLGLISVAGSGILLWIILFINPSLSYANKTKFGMVTVYHNQALDSGTEKVLNDVTEILKSSSLYDSNLNIQLCLNDNKFYPHINPFLLGQPLAFALFNKTIAKNGKYNFNKNSIEVQWEPNGELRKYNMTWLLAHEFIHNMQQNADQIYMIKTTFRKNNWKLEGHSDYIARKFKNDGILKDKIDNYLIEENNIHKGLPASLDEFGIYWFYGNYKYALIVQYLMEEKNMNFNQICELDKDMNDIYSEMLEWRNN